MLAVSPKCNPIMMVQTSRHKMLFQAFEVNNLDGTISNLSITWDDQTKVLQSITCYDLGDDEKFHEVPLDLKDIRNQPLLDELQNLI